MIPHQAALLHRLLATPEFESILDEIHQDLFNSWKAAATVEEREKLAHDSTALDLLIERIQSKLQQYESGDT